MWSKEFCPDGREAQSMAFFNAPGIERLYSGVMNRTASEPAIAALSACGSAGQSLSKSGLYSGRLPIGSSVNSRSWGASRMRARLSTRLIDVDDRLPTKYPTLYVRMLSSWGSRADAVPVSYTHLTLP